MGRTRKVTSPPSRGKSKQKPAKKPTKQKATAVKLSFSETFFRALIEHSSTAITLLNREGNVIYDSPAASGMLGYNTTEWIGKSIFDLIHPEDQQNIQSIFKELLKTGSSQVKALFRLRRKDNSWIWVEAVATNLLAKADVQAIVVNYSDVTERKQAEVQIAYQAHLLKHINDAVLAVNSQFQITAWNDAAEKMYGWSADEVIGRLSTDILPSNMTPEQREEVLKHLQEFGSYRIELVHYRKDGQPVHVEANTIALYDKDKHVTGLLSVNRDITERKQAEEALAASEAELRALFVSMQDAVMVIDRNGVYRKIAPTNPDLLYKPSYEMLGKNLWDIFPAEQADTFNSTIQEVLKTRQTAQIEYALPIGDQLTWFAASISSIDADNTLWIARDITDRKQAEKALTESETHLRTIVQSQPECVKLLGLNGALQDMNPAGLEMIEADSLEQVIGTPIQNIVAPEYRAAFKALNARIFKGESGTLTFEIIGLKGTRRWLETHAVPLRNEEGKIISLLGLTRDITERKRAEDNLRKSEERFRSMIDASPVPYALNDDQQNITYLNPAFIQTFGYDLEDIPTLADWWHKAFPEGYRQWVAETWQTRLDKAKREGTLFEPLEVNIQCKDNTQRTVIVSAASLTGSFKDIHLVTLLDMTIHKRDEEKIQRQLQKLSALRAIDTAITNTFDMKLSLKVVLQGAVKQLEVSAAAVLLFNPSIVMLEYAAGEGFDFSTIQESKLKLGEGLAGQAALERRMIHTNQLARPDSGFNGTKILKEEGFVSYYGLPLIVKGELKGVLEIFHRQELHPDQEWLDFLETLAGQAAIAIDEAQLFDELQRSNIDLNLAYDATIVGWSAALDLRDKETEGHSQRVTDMTVKLARRIGIAESELIHIRRGALLHDIGKLGVPDAILLKPDKLADDEWHIMQKHPVYAYEMLSPIHYLKPALEIPYSHHEKWDGSGYPQGLKKDEIPLSARIFAIVDVWDALTSARPYRPAWTHERTLERIKEQSGKHFDPRVVEAFLEMIDGNKDENIR